MNDVLPMRLVTLFGGLLALTIVITLLAPPQLSDAQRTSFPLSTDRGRHGLLGLSRWLRQARVPVDSLRKRYESLEENTTLPSAGNLLIVSLPQRFPARWRERAALEAWLARGNSVLLLVAAYDQPVWKAWTGERNANDLLNTLGFSLQRRAFAAVEGNTSERAALVTREALDVLSDTPQPPCRLTPIGVHPLVTGVTALAADAPTLMNYYWTFAAQNDKRRNLTLLRDAQRYLPVFWEIRAGQHGRAWVSAYADLFSNVSLGRADNARLFGNLLSIALGPGGRVIFDDMHQGLTDLYDPQAFFADARLHNTLWFVLAFWLLYLIGRGARLAPPHQTPIAPRAVDFVRAFGGLCARRLSRAALALGLMQQFFNALRARHGLPTNGLPAWELLAAQARVVSRDVRRLQSLYADGSPAKRINLIQLTHVLATLRKQLT